MSSHYDKIVIPSDTSGLPGLKNPAPAPSQEAQDDPPWPLTPPRLALIYKEFSGSGSNTEDVYNAPVDKLWNFHLPIQGFL